MFTPQILEHRHTVGRLAVADHGRPRGTAAVGSLELLAEGRAAGIPLRRQAGLAAERDASGSAFGKQFKRADRSGAPWAAVIGDSEAAADVVVLKDLRGEQPERQLPVLQLVALVKESLKAASRQP